MKLSVLSIASFLIRPKLSEDEAIGVVRSAAAEKGWKLVFAGPVSRTIHIYDGLAFIDGTEIPVCWMVDGRSGELLQLDRADEQSDESGTQR